MKYIKCIKSTSSLIASKWYGINEINFYVNKIMVFRPLDKDWVMSDKENFDMGLLLDHNPDLENETQPITKEYKMKEFQNKQHERLHNALIGAGFTDCGGKNLPNDTGECNYGYINKQLDEYIYFDYCVDGGVGGRTYIRNISNDKLTAFYGAPVNDIITHYESMSVQTQPITKDNILDVLKHNGYNESTLEAYCELCIRNSTAYYGAVMLNNVLDWLGAVEAITGKLRPLPKPEEIVLKVGDKIKFMNICPTVIKSFDYVNEKIYFHDYIFSHFGSINNGIIESVNGKTGIYKIPEFKFDRCLLDNGFTFKRGIGEDIIYYYKDINQGFIRNGYFVYNGSAILLTPENADKIIELAKLSESLERKI